jgi:hypothetical protein
MTSRLGQPTLGPWGRRTSELQMTGPIISGSQSDMYGHCAAGGRPGEARSGERVSYRDRAVPRRCWQCGGVASWQRRYHRCKAGASIPYTVVLQDAPPPPPCWAALALAVRARRRTAVVDVLVRVLLHVLGGCGTLPAQSRR